MVLTCQLYGQSYDKIVNHKHEFNNFRIAINLGHGYIPSATTADNKFVVLPVWGLDFQYWFNPKWGLAHIGVIRWLEENNYSIKSISGCSIGSLIGGVYAAGKLNDLEKWMCSITKTDILTLLDVSWDGGVLNPVPIAPTFNDETDLTIAVNLGGVLSKVEEKRYIILKKKPNHLFRAVLKILLKLCNQKTE